MAVEFSHPSPICMIGDSHVFAFSDRVYAAASGETFVFRALYCPGLSTRAFAGPQGGPDPRIITALESVRALVRGADGLLSIERTTDPLWVWVRQIEGRAAAPPIVFSTGALDLIEIGTNIALHDFALPAHVLADAATPLDCHEVLPGALPAGEVEAIFEAPLVPLRMVLQFLRERGLTRLAVLGLAALTADDRAYERGLNAFGISIPPGQLHPRFRRKLLVMLNATLRTLCAEEGVAFVDRMAATMHRGTALPDILRDITHLTPDAAAATAADIVELFAAPPSGAERSSEGDEELAALAGAQNALRDQGPVLETVLHAPEDPRLGTVHALADVRPAMRVLEVGAGDGLAGIFAAEGADVTSVAGPEEAERAVRDAPAPFDLVVAHDATERLALSGLQRFYASMAAGLTPRGRLLLRAPLNWRRMRFEERPTTMSRQLRTAFGQVAVWIASSGDQAGTLLRTYTPAELENADTVFALAAHEGLDVAGVEHRLTTSPPLPDLSDALDVRDPALPQVVAAGRDFVASVVLENASAERLASTGTHPVRFAYFWTTPEGRIRDDGGRSPLHLPSIPGSTRRYRVRIAAPREPGGYGLRIGLIQEHVRWFACGADASVRVLT